MLTKTDLSSINKLIQESSTSQSMKFAVQINNLDTNLSGKLSNIDEKFDNLVDMLEVQDSQIRVRISKIERHLKLDPAN